MGEVAPRSGGAPSLDVGRSASGRSVIVVVGMHRSGTSLCAHMLTVLGVDMASEAGGDRGNAFGHFERWEIMALQDEILGLFERSYHSATHDFPLPPAWWADFRLGPLKDRMRKLLAPFLERSQLFGFKDPRTARLIPLWNQVFAELELQPRFVICIRDPAHVGVSLHTRDGLDHETGEQRALDYMVDALRYTRRYDRCFIRYDDWLRDPAYNAKRLLEFVGANAPIDLQDLEIAAQSVFREELSRSGQSAPKARQPLVRSFFGLVDRFAERNGTEADLDDRIDDFVHHYVAFRQLLRPFEEQVTAAVGARVSLEDRLASVQASLASVQASFEAERATSSGLNAAHAGAQTRAEAAERSAESLTADMARLKEHILRLEEAQQVAAGHAARIGDLTTALAAAEADLDRVGSDAKAAAAQAQQTAAGQAAHLEDLKGALALAEAERQRFTSEAKVAEDQARNAAAGQATRIEDLTAALAAAEADKRRVIAEAGAAAEQAQRMLAEQAARIDDLSTAAAALAKRADDDGRYRVWTRLFGHA